MQLSGTLLLCRCQGRVNGFYLCDALRLSVEKRDIRGWVRILLSSPIFVGKTSGRVGENKNSSPSSHTLSHRHECRPHLTEAVGERDPSQFSSIASQSPKLLTRLYRSSPATARVARETAGLKPNQGEDNSRHGFPSGTGISGRERVARGQLAPPRRLATTTGPRSRSLRCFESHRTSWAPRASLTTTYLA